MLTDWYAVADLVWKGMTVPDAVTELGYDWHEVSKVMPIGVKRYMVDVSILANCRDDLLNASNTDN